ncbi:MAG: hypothetical protein GX993_04670 [Bacteroidales bacterium]|nr:hypothetical protein [Bacteroidales bacterium]
MKRIFIAVIAALIFIPLQESNACTSAIITGKATPDGRPLLWKHRDTGTLDNRIEYFDKSKDNSIKYAFIALVDSPKETKEAWIGTNEVGFSIMNTASYNLTYEKVPIQDQEGVVMYQALATCRTLSDFEKMLKKMKFPTGVEANFGVIDAEGGAAYYEVSCRDWVKVDANDPAIAPEGYLIYTNHSFTGKMNDGMGYIRYVSAKNIFFDQFIKNQPITPQWIFNSLSRNFYHSLLEINLAENPEVAPNGWFVDQDFIARRSTSASVVVKGVLPKENPELTVMWSVVGYPPTAVAVPLFVKSGNNLPAQVVERGENSEGLNPKNCEICDQAMARKSSVYPIKRGNGGRYFRFNLLCNSEGTGYIQRLAPYEEAIFDTFNPVIDKWYQNGSVDLSELADLYSKMDTGASVK